VSVVLTHCPACHVPLALNVWAPVTVVTEGELGVCAACAAVFRIVAVGPLPFPTAVATDADLAAVSEEARAQILASVAHILSLRPTKETAQ
jgi:hypothetical protein